MKVVVVPASSKTSAAAIRSLLTRVSPGDTIVGVYRDTSKAPAEFTSRPNFTAVKGDIDDASSLDFSGADAVITMTPPVMDGRNLVQHARKVSENVKAKIEEAGSVRTLVLVSSISAHLRAGIGEMKTNYTAEQVFQTLSIPNIILIRCGYFMENWTMWPGGLKEEKPYFPSTVTPLEFKFPMVAIRDIGESLAEHALKSTAPRQPYIFELHGPRNYSPLDVQAAFTKALGKDVEVRPIEKDAMPEFFGAFLPKEIVGEYVEMSRCFLPPDGYAYLNPERGEDSQRFRGKTEIEVALRDSL